MTAQQERPHPEHQQRMGLREFLRGGYHEIKEPVLVTWHRKPLAIWMPVEKEKQR